MQMKQVCVGEKAFVVGCNLTGQQFHANSTVDATGVHVPWNTCAMWNVAKLMLTGFLMVSEGGA